MDAIRKLKQVALVEVPVPKQSDAGESQSQAPPKTTVTDGVREPLKIEAYDPVPGLLRRMKAGCLSVFQKITCSSVQ